MKPQAKSMILLLIGLALLAFSGYDLIGNTGEDNFGMGRESGAESSLFFAFIGAMLILAGIMSMRRSRNSR